MHSEQAFRDSPWLEPPASSARFDRETKSHSNLDRELHIRIRSLRNRNHPAVEQSCLLVQNRDKLGLLRYWPKDGIYLQLSGADLLRSVAVVLENTNAGQFDTHHQRFDWFIFQLAKLPRLANLKKIGNSSTLK